MILSLTSLREVYLILFMNKPCDEIKKRGFKKKQADTNRLPNTIKLIKDTVNE